MAREILKELENSLENFQLIFYWVQHNVLGAGHVKMNENKDSLLWDLTGYWENQVCIQNESHQDSISDVWGAFRNTEDAVLTARRKWNDFFFPQSF